MPYPVLLAEDEPSLRELFTRSLADAGYSLFVAEDGPKALDILGGLGAGPFVLLTDVLLPGMNGHELATEVIRLKGTAKIGFVTGCFDETRVQFGKCADCWCILRKPFTMSELVCFVARIASREVCVKLSYQPSHRESNLECAK